MKFNVIKINKVNKYKNIKIYKIKYYLIIFNKYNISLKLNIIDQFVQLLVIKIRLTARLLRNSSSFISLPSPKSFTTVFAN